MPYPTRKPRPKPAGYLKLQENLERGTMLGHQDALAYGNNWFLDAGALRCKIGVRRLSGRIRLGHRRHRKKGIWPTATRFHLRPSQTTCARWNNGAVYRYSLGMRATPSQGKPPVIAVHKTRSNRLSKMIRFKRNFLLRWTKVAQFLGNLKDEAGEPIPVIFQPFHGPRLRHRCGGAPL